MKHKVSELEGAMLAAALAKADAITGREKLKPPPQAKMVSLGLGEPLVIYTDHETDYEYIATIDACQAIGRSPHEAMSRAIVMHEFGEEVELP